MRLLKNFTTTLMTLFALLALCVSCENEGADIDAEVVYKVTFDYNDEGVTPSKSKIIVEGEYIAEPTEPKRDGFGFDGWYSGEAKFDFETLIAADITLTAKWSTSTYNVTFDVDGDGVEFDGEATRVVEHGTKLAKPENDPTLDGYVFLYWCLDEGDATEPTDYFGEMQPTAKGDIVLLPMWEVSGTSVKFYNIDGAVDASAYDNKSDDDILASHNITSPEVMAMSTLKPEDPEYKFYEFAGWFELGSATAYDFSTEISKESDDVELYAMWTKSQYTITFALGSYDGTVYAGADSVPSAANVIPADGVTTITAPADPTWTGYEFLGWFDGETKFDFEADVVADASLTAKWTKPCLVTFNLDGATIDGESTYTQNVNDGESVSEPTATPVKEGFLFCGWCKESTFTTAYDFTAPISGDVIIYAQFISESLGCLINDEASLITFRQRVAAGETELYAIVTADFSLTSTWTSIAPAVEAPYKGVFDGGNHKISGLNGAGGLFGFVDGATIKNITIVNPSITADTGAAAVVGTISAGSVTITNCHVSGGAISGIGSIGGIVGAATNKAFDKLTMSDCSNGATITGTGTGNNVGGVIGYLGESLGDASSISNCTNSGNVTSTGLHIGGVAGQAIKTSLSGCENSAKISGKQNIGGIVGTTAASSSLVDCHNSGGLTSATAKNANMGGMVGSSVGASITYCSNSALISGSGPIGGIVGVGTSSKITACWNTGKIYTVFNNAGGIAGSVTTANLVACYNSGEIENTANITGGLVGNNLNVDAAKLTSCYNIGKLITPGGDADRTGSMVANNPAAYATCYYVRAAGNDSLVACYLSSVDVEGVALVADVAALNGVVESMNSSLTEIGYKFVAGGESTPTLQAK